MSLFEKHPLPWSVSPDSDDEIRDAKGGFVGGCFDDEVIREVVNIINASASATGRFVALDGFPRISVVGAARLLDAAHRVIEASLPQQIQPSLKP